jgi:putative copper export protein/mono/diheme cytochrome c family protein
LADREPARGPEHPLTDPLVIARAVHFASTAAFAGLFLFLFLVGEPALRASGCAPGILRKRFLAVGWSSLALALASGAIWFLLLAFDLAGHSWDVLFSQAIPWTLLTETRFGNDALVRLALAALLSICLVRFRPGRGWRGRWYGFLASLLAAGLIASLAWAGHGSAGSGALGEVQLAADALHLVSAAGWVGGLPPLLLLLAFARRANDEPALAMAADATWRFSQFGLIGVSALLATGMINTWFLVGSVPGLVGTDYGRLLLAKVVLFAVMVSFAAANRYGRLPRLFAPGTPRGGVLGRIERNGLVELGLGLVVLVIVGALGTLPPATHAQAWWPFPLRLSTDALREPGGRLELAGALTAFAVGVLAVLTAILSTRWRWPMLAAAAVLLVWGTPHLRLITAEAFPTSFFVSPTGYSARSVAAGRALFAGHCVSCHGERGRGDGPAAKDLRPPPADLTAEHIYGHSDGDLFWWITNGIGEAMPPLGAVLDETEPWNVIDFLHTNADARRLSEAAEATGVALPLPEFPVECPDGSSLSTDQLRGNVVHLVFAGPASAARLRQLAGAEVDRETTIVVRLEASEPTAFCETRDPDVIAAFALYRGTDAIDGTEFLVDASGWLRSMWFPGRRPDWEKPEILAGEIAAIRRMPGRPRPSAGAGAHIHAH